MFASEKDAALAHDVFARKSGLQVNFDDERITEEDIEGLRTSDESKRETPVKGKCKYRGVHWQKNRKRWMARYSLSKKGEKHVNLGAFLEAKHAALAFDAEARRRGRPDSALNFPNEHPTDDQIEAWNMNTAHYSMMGSQRALTSQYRGVCVEKGGGKYRVRVNIKRIVEGYGKTKGPVCLGLYHFEKQAALQYDRVCRQYGVPEKELNFPRNMPLAEVRLFDNECYICHSDKPVDPVATSCNHIFCRSCIQKWSESHKHCACCSSELDAESDLRSVTLVPWPKVNSKKKPQTSPATGGDLADEERQEGMDSNGPGPIEADDDNRETKSELRRVVEDSENTELPHCRGHYPVGTRFVKVRLKNIGRCSTRVVVPPTSSSLFSIFFLHRCRSLKDLVDSREKLLTSTESIIMCSIRLTGTKKSSVSTNSTILTYSTSPSRTGGQLAALKSKMGVEALICRRRTEKSFRQSGRRK